jgi:hypothetical protein
MKHKRDIKISQKNENTTGENVEAGARSCEIADAVG